MKPFGGSIVGTRRLSKSLAILMGVSSAGAGVFGAVLKPHLLTPLSTYDGQPSLCRGQNGVVWAGWVAYAHPSGDAVMAASLRNGKWLAPEQVNPGRGQIVRPTLCQSGDTVWAFWTESGGSLAKIVFCARNHGKWSTPSALTGSNVSAQNQEVAVNADGKIFAVWQEFHQGQYDVMLRSFSNGKWASPVSVTEDHYDDWDPTLVCDSSGGVWVAWSSYREGDYNLFLRRADQPQAKEIRLSARGEYALHPSLAADDHGRVWAAWDAVTVPRHGASGRTTITGANLAREQKPMNDPENPDQEPLVAQIRLACVQGDTLWQIPGASRALRPPTGHRLAHTALPRLCVDKDGTLWVAYRALTGQVNKAAPKAKGKKAEKWGPYWWDVFVQSYRANDWSEPIKLPLSDGTLEEAAMIATPSGVQIAYEMEHRHTFAQGYRGLPVDTAEEDDHHGDFGRVLGFNGDVMVARLDPRSRGEAAAKALVPRKPPLDRPTHPRLPRKTARYQTEAGGTKYVLLWGDLHKHSNVSRCSTGNEPTPDDHYKYSHDICQYDFLAMSDHAEHTSDFNWWRLQKLADLYNVPGYFSVLYGYEWTAKWPIGHHNVIFPDRPAPLLRSTISSTKDTAQLWAALAKLGRPALTIPHTLSDPGMGTRWDIHDDRFERVAEIFQACRGSYEYDGCPRQHVNATAKGCFYQDGLAKDYRLGTICSSDHGWGTAYAVVYATENSRHAAFQGLYDRRCYGSTTYGLVVDFRLAGHLMGEEFSLEKPSEITVFARGTTPIRSIELFSQGKLVHAVGSTNNPIGTTEAHVAWTPESLPQQTVYYYALVIQADDEMAWTSPVWVTPRVPSTAAKRSPGPVGR